jgi:hypothetical protein
MSTWRGVIAAARKAAWLRFSRSFHGNVTMPPNRHHAGALSVGVPDARVVGEPDLYGLMSHDVLARDLVEASGEIS